MQAFGNRNAVRASSLTAVAYGLIALTAVAFFVLADTKRQLDELSQQPEKH